MDQVLLVHNDNYYSFTISSSSSVEFALGTDGASPPPFSLYNSNGALVANLGTNDPLSLSAGTYYLKVTAGLTASMTGTYNFSVINTGSITTPPPEAVANGVIISAAYAPNGTPLFLALVRRGERRRWTLPSAARRTASPGPRRNRWTRKPA